MSKQTYRDTKNYIHNDLGITKEYVNDVLKQLVTDEIQKLISSGTVRKIIEDTVINRFAEKSKQPEIVKDDWKNGHVITYADFLDKEIIDTIQGETRKAILKNIKISFDNQKENDCTEETIINHTKNRHIQM